MGMCVSFVPVQCCVVSLRHLGACFIWNNKMGTGFNMTYALEIAMFASTMDYQVHLLLISTRSLKMRVVSLRF